MAVAPLRSPQTGVPFAVRSDGEIPDAEIDAQPTACDLRRGFHIVVEVKLEPIALVVFQRGSFAFPVLDDIPEMLGDAQNHRVRRRAASISAVKHNPEPPADAGQGQEIAAYRECAQVIPDTESVFRRRLPFAFVALIASFGCFKSAISRRLEDGGRDLRAGFADAAIECFMSFLFAVCPVLSRPSGVFIEDFDAGLEHWKEPVLRKVWTQ